MSNFDDDVLLSLEKLLDWKASEAVRALADNAEAQETLREFEALREAMTLETPVEGDFVARTMAQLPRAHPLPRALWWVGRVAAVGAACLGVLLFATGLSPVIGAAPTTGSPPPLAVAVVLSLAFSIGWSRMRRFRS